MVTSSGLTSEQEYATLGDKEVPASAEVEQGVVALERLPAEWYNYYIALLTVLNNTTKAKLDNIIAELDGMLTAAGITPNANLTTQMATLLGRIPFGADDRAITPTTDYNTIVKSGPYYGNAGEALHGPNTSTFLVYHVQYPDLGYAFQIAQSAVDVKELYTRLKLAGVWQDWAKMWTSANDGATSTLDAHFFDGMPTSKFAYSNSTNVGSTTDWNTLIQNRLYDVISLSGINAPTDANYQYGVLSVERGGEAFCKQTYTPHKYEAQGGNPMWRVGYSTDSGATFTVWGAWNKVWTSGNDGTGSDCDAGKVAGVTPGASGLRRLAMLSTAVYDWTGNFITTAGHFKRILYFTTDVTYARLEAIFAFSVWNDAAQFTGHVYLNITGSDADPSVTIVQDNGFDLNGTGGAVFRLGHDGSGAWSLWVKFPGLYTQIYVKEVMLGGVSGLTWDVGAPEQANPGGTDATVRQHYNWRSILAAAPGSGWSTALANPAITVPSVTSDPGSPVVGQMWLRSDL